LKVFQNKTLKVTEAAVCGRSYAGELGRQAGQQGGCWDDGSMHWGVSGEGERRTGGKCVLEMELTELADYLDIK